MNTSRNPTSTICGTCAGIYGTIAAMLTILVASWFGLIGTALRGELCTQAMMAALMCAALGLLTRKMGRRRRSQQRRAPRIS